MSKFIALVAWCLSGLLLSPAFAQAQVAVEISSCEFRICAEDDVPPLAGPVEVVPVRNLVAPGRAWHLARGAFVGLAAVNAATMVTEANLSLKAMGRSTGRTLAVQGGQSVLWLGAPTLVLRGVQRDASSGHRLRATVTLVALSAVLAGHAKLTWDQIRRDQRTLSLMGRR